MCEFTLNGWLSLNSSSNVCTQHIITIFPGLCEQMYISSFFSTQTKINERVYNWLFIQVIHGLESAVVNALTCLSSDPGLNPGVGPGLNPGVGDWQVGRIVIPRTSSVVFPVFSGFLNHVWTQNANTLSFETRL